MSVLKNKNVLMVGEQTSLTTMLAESLTTHGLKVHDLACVDVTSDILEELKIDLILLNNLPGGMSCKDVLSSLRSADLSTVIPTIVLVEENEHQIQDVLSLGAADYITEHEDTTSVFQKIEILLSQDDTFNSSSTIDITPQPAAVTTTGIRVYVVEDDPLLRNLLSIRLNKSSFPNKFSNDGYGAPEAMRQFKPDIIILDLMLPGKSGFEILREVKDDESLKNIPVIVFSNRDGQADRNKAIELGADGFYVKAMTDLSELVEKIESLVK